MITKRTNCQSSTAKPNLFIVGAPKCGTTALSMYLSGHRDIFVCDPKEPNFWSFDMDGSPDRNGDKVKSLEDYERLFADGAALKYRCDASTSYLWSASAIPAIIQQYSNAKYIVMMRNPVDLAISLHREQLYAFKEDEADFEKAWGLLPNRRKGKSLPIHCINSKELDYEWCASIGTQIEKMLTIVPKNRVYFITLDELRRDSGAVYTATLAFLGLEDDERRDFDIINMAKAHKYPTLAKIILAPSNPLLRFIIMSLKQISRALGIRGIRSKFIKYFTVSAVKQPIISKEFRTFLQSRFKDEIQLVNQLTNKDIS